MKGFLLEQKLVNLLHPLEKNEKSMVKLDSIFKALGVETENDVKLLSQYFINHRKYKELIKNKKFTKQFSFKSEYDGSTDNEFSEADQSIVPTESIELIHPNEILTALKTFVTLHHKSDT